MNELQKYTKPLEEYDKVISPNTGKEVNVAAIAEWVDFVRGCVYSYNACFGALLDNLNFVYTFDVPTQGTDGTRLFINPEWTQQLSNGEIRLVMIHELLHCVFNHMQRGVGHNAMLSNIAADFEVNGAAYIDKFATVAQLDHIGSCFSEKYTGGGKDLWAYEAIYEDLKSSGFIPEAPALDIIWPEHKPGDTSARFDQTSRAWKHGHSDAIDEINKILNNEYSKIHKKITEKYTTEEIKKALENTAALTALIQGQYPKNHYKNGLESDELNVKDTYVTYEQGWDYGVQESLSRINSILAAIEGNVGGGDTTGSATQQNRPAIDPAEAALNLPKPPQQKEGLSRPLSKDDILSQQEGANIARKAGYKGDYVKEEELADIENKWTENVEKCAGKDGSELLTRHLFDRKASEYNWQYELRKLMSRSMKNSLKFGNEWGEKRGLARDTMTLKHKHNNDGMKDIVFLVDCSGSVSDDMLSDILTECWSISQKCNIKDVTYAYFTCNVELVETTDPRMASRFPDLAVMKLDKRSFKPKGGHISGGTDFANALQWVNDIGGARCVIVVTDGYDTPVPKPSKVRNMVWCVYDNTGFKSADNSHVVNLDTTKMNK